LKTTRRARSRSCGKVPAIVPSSWSTRTMFLCPATSLASRFGRRRDQPTPIGDPIAEFSRKRPIPEARPTTPTYESSRVERLNSTSKTSIPALALRGLSCLSAASVRAASRLLGRACASGSNFMAGACDPGVGEFNLAEVSGRPIRSVHLGRPIRRAITSLNVCPNHFGRSRKYDLSQNSFGSPERCIDSPAGPADLLGAKTVHRQSRQRTRKGRSMSVHLLPIGGGDRNVRQAPTERVPINTVISHLDAVGCGSSFAPPSLSARAP
jgi:hypothetical protein